MMLEVTDGKLFYAPIGDYPQKILDLGTGTGIWAIEGMDSFLLLLLHCHECRTA
jgi:ribosomal protein L11 methylase PrmA